MKILELNGYTVLYMPEYHQTIGNSGCVYEHRYIMEQYLGRILAPEETIHHEDGNKKNNNINNLTLFKTKSDHNRYHKTGIKIKENDYYISPIIPYISTQDLRCNRCGTKITRSSKYGLCYKCWVELNKSKIKPSKENLLHICQKYKGNFTEIGKIFNISDNAVRKWCKTYNLPYHSSDYK